MSETEGSVPTEGKDEVSVLDAQEQLLRQMLGDENQHLVDMLHAGMDADEFRKSRTGKAMLDGCISQMGDALRVLRDPKQGERETLGAAYQLRVAYAAMDAVLGAVVAGRAAERQIDEHTSP